MEPTTLRITRLYIDDYGRAHAVLSGSEEAVYALAPSLFQEVRVVPVNEPVSDAYKLPEPEPPKTQLTEEQQDYGTRMLAVWHAVLPRLDLVPKMRSGGGLYIRPDDMVEMSLDQVKGWNGSWVYLWSLSIVHNGKHSGPRAVEGRDAEELVSRVRKVLERYVRDYGAGSTRGGETRYSDLTAVPWCRWVLERMPEVKS